MRMGGANVNVGFGGQDEYEAFSRLENVEVGVKPEVIAALPCQKFSSQNQRADTQFEISFFHFFNLFLQVFHMS